MSRLLKGGKVKIAFPGKSMKHAWHRKLGVPQPCAVPADAEALYKDALNKLEHDILAKMNGCGETGKLDKNDWVITCEAQEKIYPLIIETMENAKGLMD